MLRCLALAVTGTMGLAGVSPMLATSVPTTPTYTPGELVRFHQSPSAFLVDPAIPGSSGPVE